MKYHEICWHPLSCTAREAPGRFDFVTVEDGSGHRHPWHGFVKSNETTVESYPIGSMYAIYGNIYHQYTPNVSIYTSTMDPMGIGNILETYSGNILETHHQGSQVPFFPLDAQPCASQANRKWLEQPPTQCEQKSWSRWMARFLLPDLPVRSKWDMPLSWSVTPLCWKPKVILCMCAAQDAESPVHEKSGISATHNT